MCRFDDYPPETELIKFDLNNERGIAGRAHDGLIVFVDHDSYTDVKFGESWHCKLVRNSNEASKNYFAWPMEKAETVPETAERTEGVSAEDSVEIIAEIQEIDMSQIDRDGISVMVDGALFSERFTADRYSAYRSINGDYLEIIPDPRGNIPCRDSTLLIDGLECFLSCGEESSLNYVCRNGGFLVKLTA